jgi:hypothetical protein
MEFWLGKEEITRKCQREIALPTVNFAYESGERGKYIWTFPPVPIWDAIAFKEGALIPPNGRNSFLLYRGLLSCFRHRLLKVMSHHLRDSIYF